MKGLHSFFVKVELSEVNQLKQEPFCRQKNSVLETGGELAPVVVHPLCQK